MSHARIRGALRRPLIIALAAVIAHASGPQAFAQEADPAPTKKDSTVKFPNNTAGEFTPGRGFDIIKTDAGSLNISFYGLFRYLNQLPATQTFTDHLGRERDVLPRNDLNWHRTFIWLSGFFYDPKLLYNISAWSLATTQQTLIFGNLQYRSADWLILGVGLGPNLTARSVEGSWPFFAGSDRQMSEEFFRGGFSSGIWVTGEALKHLDYKLSLNNNLSQLGVPQSSDTRDLAYSASLEWQPTTGEFGPRNGFGDLENHQRIATQFGGSLARSRESRYAQLDEPPRATQIKLSDGLNPFVRGALADDVTVKKLKYSEAAINAGVKYKGFSFMSEYYFRTLNNFEATGPLPLTSIYDHGWMAEMSYMVVPKTLDLYVAGGYVNDQFRRFPWEAGGGLSFYPSHMRSWRMNLHMLHIDKSPTGSSFGYYQPGQTGTVLSLGMDIIL